MIERIIRAVAGTLVLTSLTLGYFVHPGWFILSLFVGANLLQSSMTNWCFLEDLLRKYVFNDESGHGTPRVHSRI